MIYKPARYPTTPPTNRRHDFPGRFKQMLPCMWGGDGGPNEITSRALVEGERGRSGIILLARRRSFL
ncbi:hypothetical protein [Pseudarthrobacter sp. AB1]|uniref:hypothetical protein n=1 Tax=Pseudarthrobacter sp. AB1 TaxID=2138309 RepID=UPI00186B952B|nr:hypothetical protein [Pseudarthrobacter sp. AB1]